MHRTETLNLLWSAQNSNGYLSDKFVQECASQLDISVVELEGIISFYHFYHRSPTGKYIIYLNKSIISETKGYQRVKKAFERETGTLFGASEAGGLFALRETACIGLSDQEPAALINFEPFTNLNSLKVKEVVLKLKQGLEPASFSDKVEGHIRTNNKPQKQIFFRDYAEGSCVLKLHNLGRQGIVDEIKKAQLRGMGGAYFPTGIKMQACKDEVAAQKYIVCNADEGEPGTFKDRVLLDEYAGLMIEGMIASGYAVGANEGIIYLRAEYKWLEHKIEEAISSLKRRGFLGKNAIGIDGFNFNIRVQIGAGAYVCGEETALLNSLEGKRGEPRTKLQFPTQFGFLGQPTQVNNVETFCAIARIIELGAKFFKSFGKKDSFGTKLISISGDCALPGVYEVEWGTKVSEILNLCNAEDPYFIQVSGPSGQCINAKEFGREISLTDLACGGSFMIFNSKRNILKILQNFTEFFKTESCGICTPCRAGNYIIERKLEKIANGLAFSSDYDEILKWGTIMQMASRCGLGKASTNALQMAIQKFPEFFEQKVDMKKEGLNKKFDMKKALEAYEAFSD